MVVVLTKLYNEILKIGTIPSVEKFRYNYTILFKKKKKKKTATK